MIVGRSPSFGVSRRRDTKAGTRVPSFDFAKICSLTYTSGSTPDFGLSASVSFAVVMSSVHTSGGCAIELSTR